MTAKKYFSQLKMLKLYVEQRQQQEVDLFNHLETYEKSGIEISEDTIAKAITETANAAYSYLEKKNEIIEKIQNMPDLNHIRVLYLHHIQGLTLRAVSEVMGMSYFYINRLYTSAIKSFENLNPDICEGAKP